MSAVEILALCRCGHVRWAHGHERPQEDGQGKDPGLGPKAPYPGRCLTPIAIYDVLAEDGVERVADLCACEAFDLKEPS